jgi:vancomycin resistance protein YoaR
MASRSEELPLAYARAPEGFPWRRLAYSFLVTLVAIALFGASFAVGYARMNEGRVVPGVDVGGISVAGLDRAAAQTKLRTSLPDLGSGSLSVDLGGVSGTISYRSFGRDFNMGYMLDQALDVGRSSSFLDQLQEQLRVLLNGTSVPAVMTWDSDRLANQIAQIAAAADHPASDATIMRVNGDYVVTPSVAGQTVDAQKALELAMSAVNNLSPDSTSISLDATPVQPAVTTEQAQAAVDQFNHVVAGPITVSSSAGSATISADELRGWVHLDATAQPGVWQVVVEPGPIDQFAQDLSAQFDTPATNATFAFSGGSVAVKPSSDGQAVDVQTTAANIMAALQDRVNGASSADATMAMVSVPPDFTTDQATALAPHVKMLSSWTTHFIEGPLNGNGINIQIPTNIVNGAVVNPGERFDFLDYIGPITSPPYESGGALIHGQISEEGAIGGGMCSCSTTLFNAVARYGLEIDARHNHAIYISRYPLGLDATVWIASANSRQTLAFTNDTQYPILIKGINAHNKVTFEIWGVDDGRTVQWSQPDVENVNPGIRLYEYTDSLAPGQKKWVNDPYNGMDVTVVRTVRDANGNVIHLDTFKSHYRRLDGITLIGRYPGDPKAGTTIPVSQYQPPTPPPTPTP